MKLSAPTVGPIIGYTAPDQTRIWFRGQFEGTGESSYRRCFGVLRYRKRGLRKWSAPLFNKMSPNFDMSCVVALTGLFPETDYEYQAGWVTLDAELDRLAGMHAALIEWPVLLSCGAAGLLLVYFELRSRAFSPVLAEARLVALNARIRPHFLFNSLNAVLSLVRARPQEAEMALEALSDLFRAAMRDPGEQVDTYGGAAPHGGGAFSGKDPSKVDRSAAYAMRWVAKNVVAAGLADKIEVQIAYAIGKARPVGFYLESFGTNKIDESKIRQAVLDVFDLRPSAIIRELDLLRPIYAKTAAYGHFGREDEGFTWEKLNKVADLLRATGQ